MSWAGTNSQITYKLTLLLTSSCKLTIRLAISCKLTIRLARSYKLTIWLASSYKSTNRLTSSYRLTIFYKILPNSYKLAIFCNKLASCYKLTIRSQPGRTVIQNYVQHRYTQIFQCRSYDFENPFIIWKKIRFLLIKKKSSYFCKILQDSSRILTGRYSYKILQGFLQDDIISF